MHTFARPGEPVHAAKTRAHLALRKRQNRLLGAAAKLARRVKR